MKSTICRLATIFTVLFMATGIHAYAQSSGSSSPPRLYINTVEQRGEYFEIAYEITAAGYVELHLLDDENKKLWVTGKVTDRVGDDLHRIPMGPLKPGKRYSVILKYKGKEYSTFFYTSG
ncbi:MAG: hypothetical protein NWR72_12690 [Bacteroidia bacterium]|nr:hypothetical protein [Bacteroidia bacterium]